MAWLPGAVRIYRTLLLAYPSEFRHEYGDEMERLFSERLSSESRIRVWLAALWDLAVAAPREHLQVLVRDLRHSVRFFAATPGFTATALSALAIGIGAAVTIFSLIDTVLIRDLPYGNADRLVYLWTPLPRYESLPRELGPSFADVLAWRESSRSLESISAFQQRLFTLNAGNDPVRVNVAMVLGNFFDTLQSSPLVGRTINANDDRPGQEKVAVISYGLWRSQFNLDPAALGKTVQLGRSAHRVIGVMPPSFAYPHENDFPLASGALKRTDMWVPATLTAQQQADRMLTADAAIGRLRAGLTVQQAQAEMSTIEKRLDALNLPEMRGMRSLVVGFIETTVAPVRPLMRLLAGAVILVLLIACGNVANLLMARAARREHEMGVRTALGASRARLVRQLLTESLLLSVAGGGLGALLGFAALKILAKLNPGDIPRFDEISMDGRVLVFGLLISVATGVVFGILPALASSRVNVIDWLRQGGGRGIAGGSSRVRQNLIVADVALAVILLAGAGLLIRSYLRVQGEETGFAPSTVTMKLAADRQLRSRQQMADLSRRTMERIASLPGVLAVGETNALPLSHSESTSTFRVDGYANRPNQTVDLRIAAGDYFQAMQTRLIAGRWLNASDSSPQAPAVPPAVVVSESFAKLYFPGGNALGGRVQRGQAGPVWATIVGIAGDVRHSSLEKTPKPTLYEPGWFADSLAIRTSLPADALISSVRGVVRELDSTVALSDVETMRQRTDEAAGHRKFQTILLASFAAVAIFLALVGLYGLLSYMVRQRTPEIGVRIAMGARQNAVVAMVVRQGLVLTVVGLAIGLPVSAVMARLIASQLYGVHIFDPVTFVAVPVFMIAAATIACVAPARKAARIDPVAALRQQ